MKSKLLTTKGHFRPYLSDASPKVIAPTDLNIRTSVIPHVMSFFVLSNCSARLLTVKLTVKKSKASQVHAMNAHEKNSHCLRLRERRSVIGLSSLSMGGFKVEKRVQRYRLADMFSVVSPVLGKTASSRSKACCPYFSSDIFVSCSRETLLVARLLHAKYGEAFAWCLQDCGESGEIVECR